MALQYLRVKPRIHKEDSEAIVYDADCIAQPHARLFDVNWWRENDALTGQAQGRGSAWFLNSEFGELVLRKYLRGGMIARISHDRYFFTGFSRSRPMREFEMLHQLFSAGLPVPKPAAAYCHSYGLTASGALLTHRLRGTEPLCDYFETDHHKPGLWRQVGHTIRRFHDIGVVHADLNARNILVSDRGVFLIDFDRARLAMNHQSAYRANLDRLHRSWVKLWPASNIAQREPSWKQLMQGYTGE